MALPCMEFFFTQSKRLYMSNEATRSLIRTVLTPVLSLIALTVSSLATAVTFEEVDRFAQSGAATGDGFGWSYAIDGDTVILGSPGDDDDIFGNNSGSAYIFVRNTAGVQCIETLSIDPWCQQAKLTADDAEKGELFGSGVAISGDTATVSARNDDNNNTNDGTGYRAGSVYIFERSNINNNWTQTTKLRAADPSDKAQFGWHLALEGETLAVSARKDDGPDGFPGSIYIFVRNTAGVECLQTFTIDTWCQQAKLTASDGKDGDLFGTYVALDDNTLAVGAPRNDDAGDNAGSAYIFIRNGTSWSEEAKLIAGETTGGDNFGQRVEISGNTVIVAAVKFNKPSGGAAYIFGRSSGIWSEEDKLTASSGFVGDGYGFNVEIAGDVAMVGAQTDGDFDAKSGSVYLYARTDAGWIEESKLTASDSAAGDWFGSGLAISGDTALIVAVPFFVSGSFGSALVFSIDLDDDGYRDSIDNCPTTYNPDQTDVNSDGYGDACVDPSVTVPGDSEVDPTATIEAGVVIESKVVIESGVEVGENTEIIKLSSVGEDTTIGDNSTLEKTVTVGSDVVIGDDVLIGRNTIIEDGVSIGSGTVIGRNVFIGAGAVIGINSIIGNGASIEAGAIVADYGVVAKDEVVLQNR